MSEALTRARRQLDALLVWADRLLDGERTDRQYLLEKLLEKLAVVSADLVEAERADQRIDQSAIVGDGATVFQVAGSVHTRGGELR